MPEKKLILFAVSILSMLLWSCGSDQSRPDINIVDAEYIGVDECVWCHHRDVHTEFSGVAGINTDTTDGYGAAITHDCEDCHGGGQYHDGIGALPYPSPDGARCATCHTQATKIMASKHNGGDSMNTSMLVNADAHYVSGYCQRCHTAEGMHEFGVVTPVIGDKSDITSTIVDYGETPGDGQVAALAHEDADGNIIIHNPVCGTCHNPLTKELVTANPGTTFPLVAEWDPNLSGTSDEFDLCTFCHNYYMNDGVTLFGSGADGTGTAEFYHSNSWYRIIPTTHYDDPTTLSGQGTEDIPGGIINKVEGYVIRTHSVHPCFDCHGHEFKTNSGEADDPASATIHTMWAKSGHAGGLLNKVLAAVDAVVCDPADPSLSYGKCNDMTDAAMAAYASDGSSNGGYTHYNWDKTNDTVPGDYTGRSACQKCHTATGFVNYVTAPANYDPANNDFSHLSAWTADTGSPQNEMLYCWGCHSSAESGTLRVSGAVTAPYTYGGAEVVFPDVGKSNTCFVCHGGRGNNETVSGSGYFAGHHAPAAATLYSNLTHVAYEYPGLDYSNKSYFAHSSLGDDDGSGPCVTCHMSGDTPNHEFAVVEKNDSGVIASINPDVCVTCHDGEYALIVSSGLVGTTANIFDGIAAVPTVVTQAMADAAAAFLEEESEGYREAGQLLLDLLNQANGLTNYTGAVINQNNVPDNDKGAFQNSLLISNEKGGFAHNSYYVKRAIFDAIDWVAPVADGNVQLDGIIPDYTAGYAGAMNWLGGTTRPN